MSDPTTALHTAHGPCATSTTINNSLVFLLACAAGLGVATLYYNQPILGVLAADFHATAGEIGTIPTLTQIGYTVGILLLAPLGARYDRRRVPQPFGTAKETHRPR